MQDITPPKRQSRGRIASQARPSVNNRPSVEVLYSRQSRVINSSSNGVSSIVTEEVIIVSEQPAESVQPERFIRPIESLSAEEKNSIMAKVLASTQAELRKERLRRISLKRHGIGVMAVLMIAMTIFVSIDTMLTNSQAKSGISDIIASDLGSATATPDIEGKDESTPSPDLLSSYRVGADMPRAIYIDKIDVSARTLPMGINTAGAVQAPVNIHDAGWYSGSVKPGEIGAVFINGHASGAYRQGLLAYLDTLVKGDKIVIEKGDGSKIEYLVVETETVSLEKIDMKKVLLPKNGVLRGLNIMTCTGNWIEAKQTYDQRLIIYAEQI